MASQQAALKNMAFDSRSLVGPEVFFFLVYSWLLYISPVLYSSLFPEIYPGVSFSHSANTIKSARTCIALLLFSAVPTCIQLRTRTRCQSIRQSLASQAGVVDSLDKLAANPILLLFHDIPRSQSAVDRVVYFRLRVNQVVTHSLILKLHPHLSLTEMLSV